MRVLHLTAGKIFGGVETLLVALARYRYLSPRMEPEFALAFPGQLEENLRETGVKVHLLGAVRISRPLSVLRSWKHLTELLSNNQYDLAVCHMPWPLVVTGVPLKRSRVPIVFWTHTATEGRHWLERLAGLFRPDYAIAPSDYTRATLSNIFRNTPSETIHYPVSRPPEGLSLSRRNVRSELNTPNEAVVIIQASRLDPLKGHLVHLKALGLLRDDLSWVSWIAGGIQSQRDSEYLARLKQEAEEQGIAERVRFLGQRSDVGRLLAAADVYCQPNVSTEGLPIVFTEAMYAGLPVVSTNICGFWEAVDDSCGRLVTPDNVGELASTLRELLNNRNLLAVMGQRGQLRAQQMFDPYNQMEEIYKCFTEVVRLKSGPANL